MQGAGHECHYRFRIVIEKTRRFLPWDLAEANFLKICGDSVQDQGNGVYLLEAEAEGLPFVQSVVFSFRSKLKELYLCSKSKMYAPSFEEIGGSFYERERILESLLGRPSNKCLIKELWYRSHQERIVYKWKLKKVLIVHQLWDRVGFEEHLTIKVR